MEKDRTKSRYHIKTKIGSGDFATVYSADDHKLGREVAIKQLHPHFLDDKEKLERYWQEAQLLVSIEHPNIITIFDIVRTRGRLILELMQGSLKQIYGGKPMPVQEVRQTIIQVAKGLKCLHGNGIIHGDVKPGNLLLSRQDIVKLGDFGLARRVNDSEGSLVKGTTRYMAPELVSEEFGDVGPASDLYSLGFAALEMMVGPEFDSLFPDLIAFGRDPQMAWMMWHSSPDRKLPPVHKILEGVPEDLASVIEKLTAKNQADRYTDASQVLADLSGESSPVGMSLRQQAAAAEALAKKQKKKRRILAFVACTLSLIVSLGIIFWPEEKPAPERIAPPSIHGVVQNIALLDRTFVLDLGLDFKEISVAKKDVIMLNRNERQLRDLSKGDRVVIHTRLEPEGRQRLDIVAFRPETHVGTVEQLAIDEGTFVLKVSEGDDIGTEFVLKVPPETKISLNEKSTSDGNDLTASALAVGDRVEVRHSDDESGMLALSVDALRVVEMQGVLRKINLRKWLITVADGPAADAAFETYAISEECVFELNGLKSIAEQQLKLKDLIPGDAITLQRDVKVINIIAHRVLQDQGRISNIEYADGLITVESNSGGQPVKFSVDANCEVTLGNEVVTLTDLRVNDRVELSHDSLDQSAPQLDRLKAERPGASNKWAIFIANQSFQDSQLAPLTRPIQNARAIKDQLVKRYGVPDDQAMVCEDFDRTRIEQEIPKWLERIPARAELTVYLATRAYCVPNDNVYLAHRDFESEKFAESGVQLDWILEQMDECRAEQKLLLLDCIDSAPNSTSQTSTAEMVELVKSTHRGGFPKSVFVMASCREGETVLEGPQQTDIGRFASILSSGFSGQADQRSDNLIEPTELFEFVQNEMSASNTASGSVQNPRLFLPDPSPPRISDTAKTAILNLLNRFSEREIEEDNLEFEVMQIEEMAGREPEPRLASGILLIRFNKMKLALTQLESLLRSHPDCVLAHKAVVWLNFNKKRYDIGLAKLASMMEYIPTPDDMKEDYSEATLRDFEWAGRLRELAAEGFWVNRKPTAGEIESYDRIIEKYGPEPNRRFEMGRTHVQTVLADFAKQIEANPNSQLDLKRTRLRNYMGSIANEAAISSIRDGLDK